MAITSQLAFGVYSYSAAATGVGEVGRVDYDKTLSPVAARLAHFVRTATGSVDGNIGNLTPDPKVFWFKNKAGAGRLLVAETYYSAGPAYVPDPSEFSAYDADTLAQVWPAPGGAGSAGWDVSVINVYNIVTATVDDVLYIYGIDYDNHKVFRVKTGVNSKGNETYTFDSSASYTYAGANIYTFGVDIATDGTNIYALFINAQTEYGGPYSASTIVKLGFDLDISTAVQNTCLAPNALTLNLWASSDTPSVSYFYIPALGGPQNYGNYNAGSVIQRIKTDLLDVETLLINQPIPDPDNPPAPGDDDTTDYYNIAFAPDGSKVFILKGVYTSSSTFRWRLFQTTMSVLNATPATPRLISAVVTSPNYKATGTYTGGYVWALYYNTADDNVWFVRGNDIVIYNYSGSPTTGSLQEVAGPIVMGGTPASNLAPLGFNINGAAIYGIEGTVKGAPHPSKVAARAVAAEEGEEDK